MLVNTIDAAKSDYRQPKIGKVVQRERTCAKLWIVSALYPAVKIAEIFKALLEGSLVLKVECERPCLECDFLLKGRRPGADLHRLLGIRPVHIVVAGN